MVRQANENWSKTTLKQLGSYPAVDVSYAENRERTPMARN